MDNEIKSERITLVVNGEQQQVTRESPSATLADVLRNTLYLTGTKEACRCGECGSCTVLVDGSPTLSCSTLAMDKYGLRVMCIRIGYVDYKPIDKRRLSIWVSFRDLAQLVSIGLTHAGLRYAVVYGVSNNDRGFFDNEAAIWLGYRPADNSEQYAAEVLASVPPEDPALVGTHVIGGHFSNNEFVAPISRIDEW